MRYLSIFLFSVFICCPVVSLAKAMPVELKKLEQGWQLFRDGKPYFIRGAGGDASLEKLVAAEGNSIRTWGADELEAKLDNAHALGLSVTVGIWLGHERHGFDYSDKEKVVEQFEYAKKIVLQYKDHPAVLLWGIGNEMEGFEQGDNPAIWKAVNDIAEMIKEIDPLHPTMTVTAEIGGERVKNIHQRCPAIDIHGINSYGGGPSLIARYLKAGASKPFVLTEFGPAGSWEAVSNEWGAPIELTSTEKAASYRNVYEKTVLSTTGLSLGSYVFTWGNKMEATATWFGMFLPDGARLGAVDTMTELWSGKPPEKRVPDIKPLKVEGETQVDPGEIVRVHAEVINPEKSELNVRWVLLSESKDYNTGGDYRATPVSIERAILEGDTNGAKVRMPDEPGSYRLYLYAYNAVDRAAVANVPLLVKGEVRTPMPFSVYENGLKAMPWAPSGWMGSREKLSLDGDYTDDPHEGKACLEIRHSGNYGWASIAWQHPANNWGKLEGGFDLTGANYLEFWARGKYGGERINIGLGLIGEDADYPDSGKTRVDGIVLKSEWQRYQIPLEDIDLSSIKTGLVVYLGGQKTSTTIYLDSVRYIK